MLQNFSIAACYGIYAGGASYVLKESGWDQKVFDFAAPQFNHAVGLGAVTALASIILEASLRAITGTSTRRESMMYAGTYTVIESDYPKAYVICHTILPVISAFGSTYLLRQMNYSIPYRFTMVCLMPYVLDKAFRTVSNSTN